LAFIGQYNLTGAARPPKKTSGLPGNPEQPFVLRSARL